MRLSTVFTTLFKLFATSPDLCAEVHLDAGGEPYTDALGQTFSRFCEWTGPDAPVWDAQVCCTFDGDGAACVQPDSNDRCAQGERMYCKYGEAVAAGVLCYQPFPDACEFGYCEPAPSEPPTARMNHSIACCGEHACYEISDSQIFTCGENGGKVLGCKAGQSNDDGTITCYDEEVYG